MTERRNAVSEEDLPKLDPTQLGGLTGGYRAANCVWCGTLFAIEAVGNTEVSQRLAGDRGLKLAVPFHPEGDESLWGVNCPHCNRGFLLPEGGAANAD
jgi:ribosomal protein S27E